MTGSMAMKAAIPGVTVLEAENVPETAEAERVMEGMIQQGAKLIFATSFGHQQSAFNLAKKHPDVVFEHAGGWMQAPNFGNFFAATQAAWYPMGVAAGKMTKSNTLGFVVGVPIGFAIGNVNAFALGARSVNPKARGPRGGDRQLVRQGQGGRRGQRADRSGRRRRHHARRFAGDRDPGGGEPRRLFDRLPVDRGARARAEGLDHRSRLHLGSVHDGDRQERHGRNLQARHGSRGPGRDDGDRAVRRRRAAGDAGAGDRRRRQGRQGLQSVHRADHRQYRRRADQGRRGLGRRQDGQFRLVRRRRDRQGEIAMAEAIRSRRATCPLAAAAIGLPLPPRGARRRHRRVRGAGARRRAADGVPAARGHRRRRRASRPDDGRRRS